MDKKTVLSLIRDGRTDAVYDLVQLPDWQQAMAEEAISPLQWFVYYDDVTAMRAVVSAGGTLDSIDLDAELLNAAFFGHWRVCDYLIAHGANPNCRVPDTGETPLHNALCKAARPYFLYVVRLLLDKGADVNAATIPGKETEAFMRDVRTRGETPLHRAAAYADAATIGCLLDHGADRTARDTHGDSPLSWASTHLRPGAILELLAFGEHTIGGWSRDKIVSDHGAGWGNGMEWKFVGEYRPRS